MAIYPKQPRFFLLLNCFPKIRPLQRISALSCTERGWRLDPEGFDGSTVDPRRCFDDHGGRGVFVNTNSSWWFQPI